MLAPNSPLSTAIYETLRARFGHEQFRDNQEEVVSRALTGRSFLYVAGTGSGKSLGFQLPALHLEGTCVCVSPLIALMRDQVDVLKKLGIPVATIHSNQDVEDQRKIQAEVANGRFKVIFVSPERLSNDTFLAALKEIPKGICGLAVDEAHCVSLWGHSFRPAFLRIPHIRQELGNPPLWCFTATATAFVREDICATFGLQNDDVILASMLRDNLAIERRLMQSIADKDDYIFRAIREGPDARTIIYCATRASVEKLARQLVAKGIDCERYHGGMDREERHTAQDRYAQHDVNLMIATNAFGMGVNYPDISRIVHYHAPGTLENYIQEIGRAGRNGEPANAIILHQPKDAFLQAEFILGGSPEFERIVRTYETLAKRAKPNPTTGILSRFYRQSSFLGYFSSATQLFKDQLLASIAILEDFGVIRIRGNQMEFLVTPQEAKKRGLPLDATKIEMRNRANSWRVQRMLHFLLSDKPAKELLDEYLKSTSLDIPLDTPSLWSFVKSRVKIPREQTAPLLDAVQIRPISQRTLVRGMRTEIEQLEKHLQSHQASLEKLGAKKQKKGLDIAAQKRAEKSVEKFEGLVADARLLKFGSLRALTKKEIEFLISREVEDGRIRQLKIGSTTLLVSPGREVPEDWVPNTFKEAAQNIDQPICAAFLKPPFRDVRTTFLSNRNHPRLGEKQRDRLVLDALADFLNDTHEVLGTEVKGRAFVKACLDTHLSGVTHAIELFNYLHPKEQLNISRDTIHWWRVDKPNAKKKR